MVSGKQLNDKDKETIIRMRNAGHSLRKISQCLEIPKSTVDYTFKNFKKSGQFQSEPGPGRPSKLNNRDRRCLKKVVLDNRRAKLSEITASVGLGVSESIIRRNLHGVGFHSRIAVHIPLVSDANKAIRLHDVVRERIGQWMIGVK